MPYIPKPRREAFMEFEGHLENLRIDTEGELNYLVTKMCKLYILQHGLTYKILNAIVGVLGCVKSEMYRKVVEKYEDDKMAENGEVWNLKED